MSVFTLPRRKNCFVVQVDKPEHDARHDFALVNIQTRRDYSVTLQKKPTDAQSIALV